MGRKASFRLPLKLSCGPLWDFSDSLSTPFGEWDEWRVCWQRAPAYICRPLPAAPLKNLKSTNLAHHAPAARAIRRISKRCFEGSL